MLSGSHNCTLIYGNGFHIRSLRTVFSIFHLGFFTHIRFFSNNVFHKAKCIHGISVIKIMTKWEDNLTLHR